MVPGDWKILGAALGVFTLTLALAARAAQAQSVRTPLGSMRELAHSVAVDYVSRGAGAERAGHLPEAEALYQRAIQADPGFLLAHLSLARLLAARGFLRDALRVLDGVPLRAYESDRDALELARVRSAIGDVDGALALLEARLQSPEAARGRAEIAATAGRYPEALNAARLYADLARGSADERAAATLVRALRLLVGDADALRTQGAESPLLRRLLAQ